MTPEAPDAPDPDLPDSPDETGETGETGETVARLRRSLGSVRSGDLSQWEPLSIRARRSHLATILGHPVTGTLVPLFGQPAERVDLPEGRHVPVGVAVWLQHDEVVLLDVRDPVLVSDAVTALGPPEDEMASGLGSWYVQWLYPSRGLVLHVTDGGKRVKRLLGLESLSLEAIRKAPVVSLSERRVPLHPRPED